MSAAPEAPARPRVEQVIASVVENQPVTADGSVLTLALPAQFAHSIPGQFVHVKVGEGAVPFLRRPFSILGHRVTDSGSELEIMYAVVGEATRRMQQLVPGDPLNVMGPFGNAFVLDTYDTWIMVSGGRGAVPLYRILEARAAGEMGAASSGAQVEFLFGARSAKHLWWLERLAGVTHALATDDGSAGRHGTVIDLLETSLDRTPPRAVVLACGPEPMLEAVARTAERYGVPAQVSLESRMGCAAGLCRGCVVPRRISAASHWPRDGNPTYGTVCKEGPIFLGSEIDWARVPEI